MTVYNYKLMVSDLSNGRIMPQFYTTDPGGGTVLADAITSYSLAGTYGARYTRFDDTANLTTATTGADVSNAAYITFATAKGRKASFTIPGAAAYIYQADGETVNPAMIPDIISAATTGAICNRAGEPLVTYISGYKRRLPKRPIGT